MTLAFDIRQLADNSLAALAASHDYFAFTGGVWSLAEGNIRAGQKFELENVVTGTTVSEQTLLTRWQKYETDYLTSFTFQHFVSLFEDFFFELLRLWLAAYPGSLSKKSLEFSTVLKAADKSSIILSVVNRELNVLKYERVADWFGYLERLAKLGCPTADEMAQIAEIKATRDILVHNKGVVNTTYLDKAGRLARSQAGEEIELPEPYHRESWEIIRKIVADLSTAAIAKAPGPE